MSPTISQISCNMDRLHGKINSFTFLKQIYALKMIIDLKYLNIKNHQHIMHSIPSCYASILIIKIYNVYIYMHYTLNL
jgi:hypothetical protein